ncbi:MAG: 16S rRNA (cytidine(1402)-2'-O)-methyltransferase [Desulfobacteraceae bacterium]|nr:16S rRNA (cytidine(1402)-2'-O)-methyltransferase [Desulfobacteraceae bacterium]
MDDSSPIVAPGCLYVVALPIGNRDDITLRALKILEGVDLIAAEDTRTAKLMLSEYGIKNRLTAYHEHNESEKTSELVTHLVGKNSLALVSDAGTPLVSDPGYRLVSAASEKGIRVVPIPGASAAIAALSVSGLPTNAFTFAGFMPKKKGKRVELLHTYAASNGTVIFYESPKRVLSLMKELVAVFGDRPAFFSREMTKKFEEFLRGRLSGILATLSERRSIKGECTLIVSAGGHRVATGIDEIRAALIDEMKTTGARPSEVAGAVARRYGLPKGRVYDELLNLKKSTPGP